MWERRWDSRIVAQRQVDGECLSLSTPSRTFQSPLVLVGIDVDIHRHPIGGGPLESSPDPKGPIPDQLAGYPPHCTASALSFAAAPLSLSRHVPSQPGKSQASQTTRHTRTCSCSSPVRPSSHEGPFFLHKGPPPTARRLNHPGTAADRDSSRPRSGVIHPSRPPYCLTILGGLVLRNLKTKDDLVDTLPEIRL